MEALVLSDNNCTHESHEQHAQQKGVMNPTAVWLAIFVRLEMKMCLVHVRGWSF